MIITPDEAKAALEASRAAGAIEAAWRPLPLYMLTTEPPARRWLLRHPTANGLACAPGQGDGLLPLGKAGSVVSGGGVGKTHILVQLALSVVTGRRWLGHFDVSREARAGRVLLALGEEDDEEIHRRVYSDAKALGLDHSERATVSSQVVVLPLAGVPVSLITPDGGATRETPEVAALRKKLSAESGPNGWSLIVLDPLARFAGADTEVDNSAATHFVQVVESLVRSPGGPTVLVAHHSSKNALKAGSVDSRGVSGLTDGFRWQMTLRNENGRVKMIQSKSNYSRQMLDELELIREDDGRLRVVNELDKEADKERAEREADDETNDDVCALVALVKKHRVINTRELRDLSKLRDARLASAMVGLRRSSLVVEETGPKNAKVFMAADMCRSN